MSEFAAELIRRINDAREALQLAQAAGEYDAEQVYTGELDSLYRLAEQNKPAPAPSREQLEALARDLPKLWAAQTTAQRDRKRLLRTMIADVTVASKPTGRELQVGIRWRSGATEQHRVQRPRLHQDVIRTPAEAIELTKRLASEPNAQIAEQLNAAGLNAAPAARSRLSTCNGSAGGTRSPTRQPGRATAS